VVWRARERFRAGCPPGSLNTIKFLERGGSPGEAAPRARAQNPWCRPAFRWRAPPRRLSRGPASATLPARRKPICPARRRRRLRGAACDHPCGRPRPRAAPVDAPGRPRKIFPVARPVADVLGAKPRYSPAPSMPMFILAHCRPARQRCNASPKNRPLWTKNRQPPPGMGMHSFCHGHSAARQACRMCSVGNARIGFITCGRRHSTYPPSLPGLEPRPSIFLSEALLFRMDAPGPSPGMTSRGNTGRLVHGSFQNHIACYHPWAAIRRPTSAVRACRLERR